MGLEFLIPDIVFLILVCLVVWFFLIPFSSLHWCLLNLENEGRSHNALTLLTLLQLSRYIFHLGFGF